MSTQRSRRDTPTDEEIIAALWRQFRREQRATIQRLIDQGRVNEEQRQQLIEAGLIPREMIH